MQDFSLELTLGADERKRALVIDDEIETANDFAKRLQTFGFDCDTAYDGMSALRKLRTVEYEIAIVDIKLPDISGLELLNTIRSEEMQIFAIVVSGFGDPSDRILGLEAGADDYMVKPIDYQELFWRYKALARRDPNKTLFYRNRDLQEFARSEQSRISKTLRAIYDCVCPPQGKMPALLDAIVGKLGRIGDGLRKSHENERKILSWVSDDPEKYRPDDGRCLGAVRRMMVKEGLAMLAKDEWLSERSAADILIRKYADLPDAYTTVGALCKQLNRKNRLKRVGHSFRDMS